MPPDRLDAGLEVLRVVGSRRRTWRSTRAAPHERFGYLAADDAARADDLMRAWCDPEVQGGVLRARRLRRAADGRPARLGVAGSAGPKALVGFSDVTALHQAFAARLGLLTVHGPGRDVSLGSGDDASREHLRTMLFEPAHRASP